MSRMIVSTDGLNLRSSPEILPDNRILSMPLTQEVDVVGTPDGSIFREIEVDVDGQTRRGFASSRFLRAPLSSAKERIMAGAVKEWIRFKRGNGQENVSPYYERVGDYWQALGLNYDGRNRNVFWSAAFISFVARGAGYTDFPFSDGHATYIRDAKAKRRSNDDNAPFWLFKLDEYKPQLGDIVCAWRERPQTFDALPNSFFPSHCDLVVEIEERSIKVIGGNVSQSVTQKTFALKSDGFLKPENKLFAVMRNNR